MAFRAALAFGVCLAVPAVSGMLPSLVAAQTQAGDPVWMARKCALYTDAWSVLTQGQAGAELGAEFTTRHDAFLASGCALPANVCPQSPAELALADTVSMMAVAEGMAGSFLPFACP